MGIYAGFKWGVGVLYGPSTSIVSVAPERGPAPGGNSFVIMGGGYDPRQWDDLFTGLILDPVKWTDISAGTGSVVTGANHLELFTGAGVGSVGGIDSIALWGSTQGEIRCTLPAIDIYPSAEVIVIGFSLRVDASNYALMKVTLDELGALRLRCEVYIGGLLVDVMVSPILWTTGLSVFKILRYGSTLYFIANGSVIFRSVRFTAGAAGFRIYMDNQTTPYDLQGVRIEHFYYRPFAVFQNQPVHDTVVVSDSRIRGIVPASRDDQWQAAAYEGLVDVTVIGNSPVTSRQAYEYYYIEGLKVINSSQQDVGLDVVNDEQLFTPDGEPKGLGGGA